MGSCWPSRPAALAFLVLALALSPARAAARFPRGFLLGVATSGHQAEGGDTTSNWAAWEREHPELDPLGRAVDFRHRYRADIRRAARMHLNAFRFSIEWSRIEPERGKIDHHALAFYRHVLRALRRHGLEPVVTLSHYTWPQWLEEEARAAGVPSAWEREATVEAYVSYVRLVARRLGRYIRYYITFNEPNALLMDGYIFGDFPPGITGDLTDPKGQRNFYRALCNLLAAHALAYGAIHAADPNGAMVSSNPALASFHGPLAGLQDSPALPDYANNIFFFDALAGATPPFKISSSCAELAAEVGEPPPPPAVAVGRTLDYLSFDYYYSYATLPDPTAIKLWEQPIYPRGLLDALRRYSLRYPGLPILIAENGLGTENGRPRADGWTREAAIVQHLVQVEKALAENIPVIGYLHWSITDNYEWGSYTPRFGLYRVDALSDPRLRRRPTRAVRVYRRIARARTVPRRLRRRYPDLSASAAPGHRLEPGPQ